MVSDILNSKHKLSSRLHSVDICRGLALLFMIEAHIPQSVNLVTSWSGILAAPFFLITSGLSYDLFLSSRIKNEAQKYIILESVFRGLFVYLIPLLPYAIVGIFFMSSFSYVLGHKYEINIIHWGIFQVIGVAYIFSLIIPNNLKSKILVLISIFIISYIIKAPSQQALYFLVEFKPGSYPLLPWIGYFLFGRIIYELHQNVNMIKDNKLMSFSIVFLILNLLMFKTSGISFLSSNRVQFPIFLLISSIYLLIFSLIVRYIDNKHYWLQFMSPIESIGKICFTAYYVHYLLLFILVKSASFFPNYFSPVILNLLMLVIIAMILVKLEQKWRNFNYMFGFEWFIRKGTDKLLKLSRYNYKNLGHALKMS